MAPPFQFRPVRCAEFFSGGKVNIKGLSRGILAGPVHDAGWNSFFAKLSYKAASAGRELVKEDPRETSQVCVCGAAVPKTLAERWHECPVCGLSAPRDVVSAQVILQRARIGRSRHNVEDVSSHACREKPSPFRRRSDHDGGPARKAVSQKEQTCL